MTLFRYNINQQCEQIRLQKEYLNMEVGQIINDKNIVHDDTINE